MRTPTLFVFFMLMFAVPASAQQPKPEQIAAAKEEIWAIEKSIYASRSQGKFQLYIDGASPNFLAPFPTGGWESGRDGLRRTGNSLAGNSREKIAMNFKAFTLQGDTAVLYYLNHRTVRPNGEPVDEWYEVMHVWVRKGEGWQILASMPRQVIDYKP